MVISHPSSAIPPGSPRVMAQFQLHKIHSIRIVASIASLVIFIHFFQQSHKAHCQVNDFPKRDGVGNHTSSLRDAYDYTIAGGGQSGLTVASRLSSGRATVLVVEYGYLYHDDPLIARPWQHFDPDKDLFQDPKLMHNFSSDYQVGLNNRTSEVSAAASLVGGSTVNGMFLNRGATEDYDAWEKLGNPGWDDALGARRRRWA